MQTIRQNFARHNYVEVLHHTLCIVYVVRG